ncbi:MAG: helix-turn-helix transcriptional regulator [bacterium]|nr:helix-turn-helix transcriptional regulator [bacterium]
MNSNRLFFIREELDLTQDQLGEIVNTTRVSVSRWEHSQEIIPIRKANIISNKFNYSLDYMFYLSNVKHYNNSRSELNLKLIGERIAKIRKDNNLTLRDLANKLGTSSSTISAYETGKTLMLTAFAYQMCKEYNLSMDWLYGKID